MSLRFTKMHGLGNDFVVIDDLGKPDALLSRLTPNLVQTICNRRLGIGADQLLWLKTAQAQAADVRLEIFNSDGSTAQMCGNGIRAVGLYLVRYALDRIPGRPVGPDAMGDPPSLGQDGVHTFQIETLSGVKEIEVRSNRALVEMGVPVIGAPKSLTVQGRTFDYIPVDVGNPHAVILVNRLDDVNVAEVGPLIEVHSHFPNRTNVEFVQILAKNEIQVRVWERGAGLTLACGTGACASAVAAIQAGKLSGPELSVLLPGGELKIFWKGPGHSVEMEGPATEVFRGEYFV